MNSSLTSNASDEVMDELNWTADFATPDRSGKGSSETSLLDMSIEVPSTGPSPCTPPSSKRACGRSALKLFDTPCTPTTLLRRASQSENLSPGMNISSCSGIKAHYQTRRRSTRLGALKRLNNTPSPVSPISNPFQSSTPLLDDRLLSEKKRRKMRHNENLNDIKVSLFSSLRKNVPSNPRQPQKIALDLNESRYKKEFHELRQIGAGQFGEVYKCQNRVDRCYYALKRLIKPMAGSIKETSALREVYAHAVLGKHQHILQYYSAWAEDKHMIIQNEYCNGGSLTDTIVKYQTTGIKAPESDLIQILIQVSKGLRYMHSMDLVHLDIKPGNIFISYREVTDDENRRGTCYKIGDMGMVTKISNPTVEDGDVRYLPKELIDDDYTHLTKADVFSLSLTVYEVASLIKLPNNGPHWHAIREGKLAQLPNCSANMHDLILRMIDKTAKLRPSPAEILKERFLVPEEGKKICELTRKLNEEKIENQRLLRELEKAKDSPLMKLSSSRLVGKQLNRSMSIA